MKLILENWRRYLNEKRWQHYAVAKGVWGNVPLEDIQISETGEITVADELYRLIDNAYAKIGGHFDFQSASDLPADYTDWLAADLDGDPEPDVLRVSKDGTHGQKMAAAGHDGSRHAVDTYLAKTADLLHARGHYGEMSKGIAHIMITRHGVPFVSNKEDVQKVLGKEITWLGKHPEGKYPRDEDNARPTNYLISR